MVCSAWPTSITWRCGVVVIAPCLAIVALPKLRPPCRARWLTCFTRSFKCSNTVVFPILSCMWLRYDAYHCNIWYYRFHFHWWDFFWGEDPICSIISIESNKFFMFVVFSCWCLLGFFLPKKMNVGLSDSWVHCCLKLGVWPLKKVGLVYLWNEQR